MIKSNGILAANVMKSNPLMNRKTEVFISDWQQLESRKPLVLRGARQVGTTYLVQHWGKERFRNVLTVDFGWERD